MKKVILVHGWEGSMEDDWFPWLIDELKKKDYEVVAFNMKDPETPIINEWVSQLREEAGEIDDSTIFVGHSIGCQTIMRFLAGQEKKVAGVVFVAGWFDLIGLENGEVGEIAGPWIETPVDFGKLKEVIGKTIVFLSDNDKFVPLEITKKKFEENLGAQVTVIPNAGHITSEEGFGPVPFVLEAIENL